MTIHEFINCGGRPGGIAHIEIRPATAAHEVPDGAFVAVVIHSDDDGSNEVRVVTRISAGIMAEIAALLAVRS